MPFNVPSGTERHPDPVVSAIEPHFSRLTNEVRHQDAIAYLVRVHTLGPFKNKGFFNIRQL